MRLKINFPKKYNVSLKSEVLVMFSRKMIIEAFTRAKNLKSHAELNNFIFKHGLEDALVELVLKINGIPPKIPAEGVENK